MQSKQKKFLEKDIEIMCNGLVNQSMGSDEQKDTLNVLVKEMQLLDTMTKVSSEEKKMSLDEKRLSNELSNRERQLAFEESKAQAESELNKEKFNFEKDKHAEEKAFNNQKFNFEYEKCAADNEFKRKELALKEKAEKRNFIIGIASIAVPATIGLISNIIAMRYYNRLAVRALNMEYIDNSISPRSYNECMNNINKFVSKK